jgi:argininosuccinate lyase
MADEIILWYNQQFSFINLPDELATGSSILPQKKKS